MTETLPLRLLTTNSDLELQAQLLEQENTPQDLFILAPEVNRYFRAGVVLRYALRYTNGDYSGYVKARQGRYTYATLAPAERELHAIRHNNDASRLALYGGAKGLYVAFTACYGEHYDPAPIDLDCTAQQPAALTDLQAINRLLMAVLRCQRDYDPTALQTESEPHVQS